MEQEDIDKKLMEPPHIITTQEIAWRNNINTFALDVYETAVKKGWHNIPVSIPTLLSLIHSEVSEVLDVFRNDTKCTDPTDVSPEVKGKFGEEIADIILRCFDLARTCNVDIGKALVAKHYANQNRPYRHGNKRA